MNLSRPKTSTFLLAAVLAALAIIAYFGLLVVPVIGPVIARYEFELLLVAFLVLAVGNLFKGV
ncbi:MAG: hypothetical protein ACFB2Z_03805 [Maricaulaceae bacterium]